MKDTIQIQSLQRRDGEKNRYNVKKNTSGNGDLWNWIIGKCLKVRNKKRLVKTKGMGEADSHDPINRTKNWLEYNQKIFVFKDDIYRGSVRSPI